MNIYEEMPQVAETVKITKGYVTYIYLDRRKLTSDEIEGLVDGNVGDGSFDPSKEYWTAHLTLYKHEQPLTEADYGPMVNAIIRGKYSESDVEAITNNYLQETDLAKLIDLLRTTQNFNKLRGSMSDWLSSRDADIVGEYENMQEWRQKAKEAAKIAIGIV
jgi:hypothetical protein